VGERFVALFESRFCSFY